MYGNLLTFGVVSAKRNSFQNYKKLLNYIYSGARKNLGKPGFYSIGSYFPSFNISLIVVKCKVNLKNSPWKQAACHALEAGSSLRGLPPPWTVLPQCFNPEWALFWDQRKALPCIEGMFNILSEFSAIFLCKHSQHNFYSGLNKRKAEALLVRHSGVTVQNV